MYYMYNNHWPEIKINDWENNPLWNDYCIPNTIGFGDHFRLYNDIVEWILNEVHYPRRRTRWAKIGDAIYVRFKREEDYLMFMLKWVK